MNVSADCYLWVVVVSRHQNYDAVCAFTPSASQGSDRTRQRETRQFSTKPTPVSWFFRTGWRESNSICVWQFHM